MLDSMPELVESLRRMTSPAKFRRLWQESKVVAIGTILGLVLLVMTILGMLSALLRGL